MDVLAYDLVDVLWSTLWLFLFLVWVFLFVVLLTDIVRSPELSGWHTALWVVCLVGLPLAGALVYLIARGDGMAERRLGIGRGHEAAFRGTVEEVAVTSGRTPGIEVAKLAELHDRGLLTDEEYVHQRTRALA